MGKYNRFNVCPRCGLPRRADGKQFVCGSPANDVNAVQVEACRIICTFQDEKERHQQQHVKYMALLLNAGYKDDGSVADGIRWLANENARLRFEANRYRRLRAYLADRNHVIPPLEDQEIRLVLAFDDRYTHTVRKENSDGSLET